MAKITLTPVEHQGRYHIQLNFKPSSSVSSYIEKYDAIKWSETLGSFCMPFSKKGANLLYLYLRKGNYFVDYGALKNIESKNSLRPKAKTESLPEEKQKLLQEFKSYLKGLRLSKSTVATYATFIYQLLLYLKETPLAQVDNEFIRHFIEYIISKKKYSISTHRQMMGAIKHFGHLFKETAIEDLELRSPKKSSYLPIVLSQQEVIQLLASTANLKHRTILALLYSAGLRIGEVINLNIYDLDVDRMQITIHQAKGRKDRYVMLAESILPLLMNYLTAYTPKTFFIEGTNGNRYTASSIRAFLKKSCKKAEITKRVTPHTLRHSYATHLIENGVGIRHIQELLGHSKPETTMIYTHIAKKDLLSIKSPLDTAIIALQKSTKANKKVSLSGHLGH